MAVDPKILREVLKLFEWGNKMKSKACDDVGKQWDNWAMTWQSNDVTKLRRQAAFFGWMFLRLSAVTESERRPIVTSAEAPAVAATPLSDLDPSHLARRTKTLTGLAPTRGLLSPAESSVDLEWIGVYHHPADLYR